MEFGLKAIDMLFLEPEIPHLIEMMAKALENAQIQVPSSLLLCTYGHHITTENAFRL